MIRMTNAFILCDLYEKFRKVMQGTENIALRHESMYDYDHAHNVDSFHLVLTASLHSYLKCFF